MTNNKIQIVLEAINNTKSAFREFESSLTGSDSAAGRLKTSCGELRNSFIAANLAVLTAAVSLRQVGNAMRGIADMTAKAASFDEQMTALDSLSKKYSVTGMDIAQTVKIASSS
ncbi:MAG: hypothetical protein HZB80_11280 [Deltaproteobacteria bacterium]|nr:hypothetical protein [Deltaproteobacteria bacterium]